MPGIEMSRHEPMSPHFCARARACPLRQLDAYLVNRRKPYLRHAGISARRRPSNVCRRPPPAAVAAASRRLPAMPASRRAPIAIIAAPLGIIALFLVSLLSLTALPLPAATRTIEAMLWQAGGRVASFIVAHRLMLCINRAVPGGQ